MNARERLTEQLQDLAEQNYRVPCWAGNPNDWHDGEADPLAAVAKRCQDCRAITECAAAADENKDTGVWAGTIRTGRHLHIQKGCRLNRATPRDDVKIAT